ncbi:hypothetical protein O181_116309, partial [Austropuccinia psidii MF-1]|nr:hypothetical protein [Austropuccinia psidii MF-1]
MEICDCPNCIKFNFTDQNGKQSQGVLVSSGTCNCQSDPLLSDSVSKATISEPDHSKEHQQPPDWHQETQNKDHCMEKTFVELICNFILLFFVLSKEDLLKISIQQAFRFALWLGYMLSTFPKMCKPLLKNSTLLLHSINSFVLQNSTQHMILTQHPLSVNKTISQHLFHV